MKIFVLVLSALVSSAFPASETLWGHRHAQAVAYIGSISELGWIDANRNQRVNIDGSNIVPVQTLTEFADTMYGYKVPNAPLATEALTTRPVGAWIRYMDRDGPAPSMDGVAPSKGDGKPRLDIWGATTPRVALVATGDGAYSGCGVDCGGCAACLNKRVPGTLLRSMSQLVSPSK